MTHLSLVCFAHLFQPVCCAHLLGVGDTPFFSVLCTLISIPVCRAHLLGVIAILLQEFSVLCIWNDNIINEANSNSTINSKKYNESTCMMSL